MEPPVPIKLKSQPQAQKTLRSKLPVVPELDIEKELIKSEQFYAVKSDNEEGFIIVKCKKGFVDYFEGYFLEKCSDDGLNLSYKILGMLS